MSFIRSIRKKLRKKQEVCCFAICSWPLFLSVCLLVVCLLPIPWYYHYTSPDRILRTLFLMLQYKQFFAYQHPLCWEYLQHTEAPIHWLILVLLKDRHWLGTSQNLVPGSELWRAKVERHPFLQERDAKIQPATHTTVPTAAFPACTDTDACPSETEFLANTLLSLLTWKESLYQKGCWQSHILLTVFPASCMEIRQSGYRLVLEDPLHLQKM